MIFNSEPQNWNELQIYVGQMFEECGFETEISKVVDLVRGKKEIDVITKDISSEYLPIILIECKFWNKAVSQETIHSFRTVVSDFGASLGFIVSILERTGKNDDANMIKELMDARAHDFL